MTPIFIINKYEIALFPSSFDTSDLTSLASKIKDSIPEFDNNNTAVLPLPKEIPPETPRILLKSDSGDFSCTISLNKIDIFWNNLEERLEFENENTIEKRLRITKKICSCFDELSKFKRVGLITEFFYVTNELDELYPKSILGKNSDIKESMTSYMINYTIETKDIESYSGKCNKVINIGNGKTSKEDGKVVLMQFDLNTHQDENFDGTFDKIEKFIKEANEKSRPKELYEEFIKSDG